MFLELANSQGLDVNHYRIGHSHLPIIFTDAAKVPLLLKLAPRVPWLKIVVSMDLLPNDTKRVLSLWANERNIQVLELVERESV
jgi:long-chain acyl-CoA synthetase